MVSIVHTVYIAGKFREVYVIIREIFSRVLLHYIIKQGLLAIMALLKYFRFSQGLLILNAACQAQ